MGDALRGDAHSKEAAMNTVLARRTVLILALATPAAWAQPPAPELADA